MNLRKFLFLSLVLLLPIKRLFADPPADIVAYSQGDNRVFRITDGGGVSMSSGMTSAVPLWGVHETFLDLPGSSNTNVRMWLSVATTTLNSGASTFYLNGFIQPTVPRGLQFTARFASGTVVIVGSNTAGAVISETMLYSSGVASYTNNAFSFVSSFTVNALLGVSGPTEVNVLFALGVSSYIGLANNLVASTDVYKVTENSLSLTTMTVNAPYATIPFPSAAANSDYNVWYWVKKSLSTP